MSNIKVLKYNKNILPQILKFIKKSKMTKRTKNTWIKNNMTSVNVKDGNKIIGVLPFEKIHLKVNNKFEKVLATRNEEGNPIGWVKKVLNKSDIEYEFNYYNTES